MLLTSSGTYRISPSQRPKKVQSRGSSQCYCVEKLGLKDHNIVFPWGTSDLPALEVNITAQFSVSHSIRLISLIPLSPQYDQTATTGNQGHINLMGFRGLRAGPQSIMVTNELIVKATQQQAQRPEDLFIHTNDIQHSLAIFLLKRIKLRLCLHLRHFANALIQSDVHQCWSSLHLFFIPIEIY